VVGLCLFVTFVSPTKIAELIETLFGRLTQVGLKNHILDGSLDPPRRRGNFGGCPPIEKYWEYLLPCMQKRPN